MFATLMFDKGVRKIVYDVEEGIELVAQTDKDGTLRFLVRKKVENDISSENVENTELDNMEIQIVTKSEPLNTESQLEVLEQIEFEENATEGIKLWMARKDFYRPFKPSSEQKEYIKYDYENGASLRALARDYHTTSYKIELLLKKMKVKIRKKAERSEHLSHDKKEAVIKLLTLGFDKDEIADELNITYAQVVYFCKNNNIIS